MKYFFWKDEYEGFYGLKFKNKGVCEVNGKKEAFCLMSASQNLFDGIDGLKLIGLGDLIKKGGKVNE